MTLSLPQPLERFSIPAGLDGSAGGNRAPAGAVCQITASNDLQAVQAWLGEFRHSPQTLRQYRKEAERLLLWALLERGKALSGLSREDCLLYEDFLADPRPRTRWCAPKAPRYSERWRPFTGPLAVSSQRTALLIVNALFSYLVEARYLAGNPLALTRRRARQKGSASASVERYLDRAQWQALLDTVADLPRETIRERQHYERVRFLIALLYLLGPRVGEIAGHTMGSFVQIRGRWWWRVTGKGDKLAQVPVNQDMLQALQRYRRFLGLPALPAPEETTPLVLSLKGHSGISDNMIYRIVKDLVKQAAERLARTDTERAVALRQASTHWFRHTSITHQAEAGIELRHVQANARHARLDTTGHYLHQEEDSWHEAMERHRLQD